MSSSFRISAVTAVALVVLCGVPAADATAPGKNGRVTFMRKDPSGLWQVWVAGAGLVGARRLTDESADSGWPVWSPDGNKIAFDSSRTDPNPDDSSEVNDIFVMNPDGTDVTKLTDSHGVSADPAWSPDGSLMAFDADRGEPSAEQGIYVMNADGTGLRRITTLPAGATADSAPRFSPDGQQLVFTRYRGDGQAEKAALYVVRLDGMQLRRLTSFAIHAGDADWSPNGRKIMFEAYPSPKSYGDIFVVRAGGGVPRNITRNPVGIAGSADPVWAPDGTKVMFLDNRVVGGKRKNGLATMRPNGSARSFLSPRPMVEHQPDWESAH